MLRLVLAGALTCATLPLSLPAAYAEATATVVIGGSLSPRSLTVAPGTRVVWRNDDGDRHRPRSVSGPDDFDVDLDPGESGSVTLSAAGTYSYVDDRDEDDAAYHGTIVVRSGTAPAPPPSGGGGGGGGGSGAAPSAPSSASVSMGDRVFSPGSVTVAEGGTVTWTNNDGDAHTATGGGFDSGLMSSGARYAFRFATAGTYRYVCELHSDMTGTVAVVRPGQTAPPPRVVNPSAPRPAPAAAAPAPVGPVAPGATARTVRMHDFSFAPASLSARVGDRITFVNAGQAPHTADSADGTLRSGMVRAGGSYVVTPRRAGTIRYVCAFHPQMTGVLTVGAASAGLPPAAAAPPPASVGGAPPVAAPTPSTAAPETAPDAAPGEERREQRFAAASAPGRGMTFAALGLGWLVVFFLGAVWLRNRGEPALPYTD